MVPGTHAALSLEGEPLARTIRAAMNEAAERAQGVRWYSKDSSFEPYEDTYGPLAQAS